MTLVRAPLRTQHKNTVLVLLMVIVFVSRWPSTRTTTQKSTVRAPPRFIVLVALEGTGHHFYSALVSKSPNFIKLPKSDVIRLQQSLYNNRYKEKSLWGAPCPTDSSGAEETLSDSSNFTSIFDQVVINLRTLHRKVDPTVTIPINGPKYLKSGFGMMSYPTYSSLGKDKNNRCALTKYPNIDLLYQACQDAKVTCGHIYLHRDPSQVLHSTTVNRHFHTVAEALHLYNTMLHVIYGQLLEHSHHLVTCWDYEKPPTYSTIGKLLGWQSHEEFDSLVKEIYQPSNNNYSTSLLKDPYFLSLQRVHDRVKGLCQQQQKLV